MIEIKLKAMLDSTDVLRNLAQKELNGRTAYNSAKLLKQIEEEFSIFNETRQKVVDKYVEHDENGNPKINDKTNSFI